MIPRGKAIANITSTPKRRRLDTGRILRPILQGFSAENVTETRCSSPLDRNDDPPLPCNQIEYLYESENSHSTSKDIPPSPDILEDSVMTTSSFCDSPLVSKNINNPTTYTVTLDTVEEISSQMFQSKLQQEISSLIYDKSLLENMRDNTMEFPSNNNESLVRELEYVNEQERKCEDSTSLLMSRNSINYQKTLENLIINKSEDKILNNRNKSSFISASSLLQKDNKKTKILQEKAENQLFSKISDENMNPTSNHNHDRTLLTTICEKYFRENVEDSFDLVNQSFKQLDRNEAINKTSLFETKDSFLLDIKESGICFEEKQPKCQNILDNVDNHVNCIEGGFYGLPIETKEFFKTYRNIDKFYDWQEECLNLPAIKQHRNLIYALPTSGGKTLVAEVLMMREVLNRRRNALFILPFVAIVQEKIFSLSPFAVKLDFLLEEYTGGKGAIPPKKRRHKHSIYIATIEKGLAVVRSLIELGRLDEIGLIVVDELHLVGEPGRGATLEILLTTVMFANKNIQIVGMSATIGNLPEVALYLDADVFQRDFRPVELTEYVKRGDSLYRLEHGVDGLQVVFEKQLVYDYTAAGSALDPDRLGGLVADADGPVLVFCPTKRNAENVASLLCQLQRRDSNSNREAQMSLAAALREEGAALSLCRSVTQGIAYHHAGLSNDERSLLESAYKSGVISVLCCTCTLAAGVNLPARRVIVRSPRVGNQPITLATYRQMAGRAGRAGHAHNGECITICSVSEWPAVCAMLSDGLQAVGSVLTPVVDALLASGVALQLVRTKEAADRLLAASLLAQTHGSPEETKQLCADTIRSLIHNGILEVDNSPICHDKNLNCRDNNSNCHDKNCNCHDKNCNCHDKNSNCHDKKSNCHDKNCNGRDNNLNCHDNIDDGTILRVSNLGRAAIKGCLDIPVAKQLASDLTAAGRSLILLGPLHLLYLVTPCNTDIRPDYTHYYTLYCNLDEEGIRTAKVLGITEMNAIRMVTGKSITNVPQQTLRRFYLALMLHDLWKQLPAPAVADKYCMGRGTVQSALTCAVAFASGAARFTEELGMWSWAALFTALALRLHTCAAPELAQLMELPSVKKARALQLSRAGYKRVEDLAKASVDDLVTKVEHLSRTNATHLVSAARMMLIEKVENLRAEAEEVMEDLNM